MEIAALQFGDKVERINFWQEKGVTVFERGVTDIAHYDVLFIHTSDFPKLDAKQKKIIIDFSGWKIRYTGDENVTVTINSDKKEVDTLSWQIIENYFGRFIEKVGDNKNNILDAIGEFKKFDKKLEELLKPFETSSPIDGSIWRTKLLQAKGKLNDYLQNN